MEQSNKNKNDNSKYKHIRSKVIKIGRIIHKLIKTKRREQKFKFIENNLSWK